MTPLSDDDLARRVARAELVTRAWLVTGIFLVTILLAVSSIGTILIYERGKDNRATLDLIQSCTTPRKPCYQRGQQQTGQAVANINKVVILAAACAARHPGQTIAQVQTCVIDRLTVQHKR